MDNLRSKEYQLDFLNRFLLACPRIYLLPSFSEQATQLASYCAEARRRYEQKISLLLLRLGPSEEYTGRRGIEPKIHLKNAMRDFDRVIQIFKHRHLVEGLKLQQAMTADNLAHKRCIEQVTILQARIKAKEANLEMYEDGMEKSGDCGNAKDMEHFAKLADEAQVAIKRLDEKVAQWEASVAKKNPTTIPPGSWPVDFQDDTAEEKKVAERIAKVREQHHEFGQKTEQLVHENENLQKESTAAKQLLEDHEKAAEAHKINLEGAHRQREEVEKNAQRKQESLEDLFVNMKLYWESHVKEQEKDHTQRKAEMEKATGMAQQQQVAQRKEIRELRGQLDTAQRKVKEYAEGIENGNQMLKETGKLLNAAQAELEQKKRELTEEKESAKILHDTFMEREDELEAEFDKLDNLKRELLARENEVQKLQNHLAVAQEQAHHRAQPLQEAVKLRDEEMNNLRAAASNDVERLQARIQELEEQLREERASAERQIHDLNRGIDEERKLKEAEIASIRAAVEKDLERMEAQVQEIKTATQKQVQSVTNEAKKQQNSKDSPIEEEIAEVEVNDVEGRTLGEEEKYGLRFGSEDGDWEQVEKEVEGVKKKDHAE